MITDRLENLESYLRIFPQLKDLVSYVKQGDLSLLTENTSIDNITLVPLTGKENPNFDPALLEAHRKQMDVHVTLKGTDRIAYQLLDDKIDITSEYDETGDYLLGKGQEIISLDVPEGYFCIIPNHFAHMALYKTEVGVKKVVVKMSA